MFVFFFFSELTECLNSLDLLLLLFLFFFSSTISIGKSFRAYLIDDGVIGDVYDNLFRLVYFTKAHKVAIRTCPQC